MFLKTSILTCAFLAAMFHIITPVLGELTGAWEEYEEVENRMLSDPDFLQTLKIVDVTNHSKNETLLRRKRSIKNNCPTFTQMKNATKVSKRSLSPWVFVRNYDSRRPKGNQYILESDCCFEYCINPKTGKKLPGLLSEPLKLQRATLIRNKKSKKYEPQTILIEFGCHCMFASNLKA